MKVHPVHAIGATSESATSSEASARDRPRAQSTDGFLANVHLFRGVAILAVVATHVLFELDWRPEYLWEFKLSLSVVQNGTVLFVFIAGLLFQHLSHRFSYRTYLWSKAKFVILPYLIVSVPYIVLQYQRGFGIFASTARREFSNPVAHALSMYLSGAQMPIPLWFVPMISVFYLTAPVLLWVDRKRYGYWVIPPLLLLASFIHRPQNQIMLRQSVFYFLPVYLSGMWVKKNMTEVMTWARRLRWPALALCAGIATYEVLFRQRPGAIESARAFSTERGLFDVNIYMKLALSLLVLESLRNAPRWLGRVLDPLASMSFGIFFVHFYFVYFAREVRATLGAVWPGTFLGVASYTVLVVVLSVATIATLRAILGKRSRYVIGC